MNFIKNKLVKLGIMLALTLGISTAVKPLNVNATLGNPVIEAYVMKNGALVPLGNEVAYSTVTLKSNVPVIFYLYDNAITETYTTSTTITQGYSMDGFKYYGIDQQGRMSDQITVKMDINQAPILTGIIDQPGMLSVTLNAMKESYWVVNGVKSSDLSVSRTFTERGDYTVYAESRDGLKSNVMTFSIPTKGAATTTTTTKKPVVTTKQPTSTTKQPGSTTTKPSTSGQIALTLNNVVDGGTTNQDVVIEAKEDVFFIVNGVKETKASKTLTLTQDGTYVVSAENAKKQTSEEVTVIIDKTNPILTLQQNGVDVTPGIFTEPVTVVANESGVFYINGKENYGSNNSITIVEAGTYTVEFVDNAGNKASIDFVLNIESGTEKPSDNGGSGWLLYLVIGVVAGAAVALGGSYLIGKKNKKN